MSDSRIWPGRDRLGAVGDVGRGVLPQHHLAHVDADAGAQGLLAFLAQRAQRALVVERECDRLHRALEQHQETVGLVDLAPGVAVQQVARDAVVALDQLGGGGVAEALHQRGRIGQIAHQHRAQLRYRARGRRGDVDGCRCIHRKSLVQSRGQGETHGRTAAPAARVRERRTGVSG
jgi:hypothetical protein